MKIISSISRVIGVAAVSLIGGMMLLTVADIFMLNVFTQAIRDTKELVEYMMVCVAFLGLAWCALRGRHVKVELVMSRFSPRVQAIVDSITYLAGLVVCVILSWQTFLEVGVVQQARLATLFLKVPMFPFYFVTALGWALLCLALVTLVIENVTKAVKE